jgi:chaperone modulatory protein CbpM
MDLAAIARMFPETDTVEITRWVERGWVLPEQESGELVFQEIDVARVRLIRDLRSRMALEEDSIPVVLSLMDQVYELRGRLRSVLHALEGEPQAVREKLIAALRGGRGE